MNKKGTVTKSIILLIKLTKTSDLENNFPFFGSNLFLIILHLRKILRTSHKGIKGKSIKNPIK